MGAFVASNATWNTTAGNKGVAPTPAVGELIIAFVGEAGLTSGYGVTDNQAGGTYTQIGTIALNNASADSIGVWIRDNLVASAVSHSINTTGATASTGGGIAALRVSGMTRAGLAAVRRVAGVLQFGKQENQAAGTPAPAFPAAADPGSVVLGAVLTASSGTTQTVEPAGWTERHDLGFITPTTGLEVATRDSGETGTTITWGGPTASSFASIIIELDVSEAIVWAPPARLPIGPAQGPPLLVRPFFDATPGAAAPQTFPISVGGAVSPFGSIFQRTSKPLAGATTPSGALAKLIAKALAGATSPAGTLAKLVAKPLAGATTPSGALAKLIAKALAGATTPSGALVKKDLKALAGATSPTGALTKQAQKAASGSTSPAGSLFKLVAKALAGSVSSSGTVALVRVILRSFTGSTSPTGALTKRPAKAAAGATSPTGVITKRPAKVLAGTSSPAGSLTKAIAKALAGAVSPSGALVRQVIAALTPALDFTTRIRSAFDRGGQANPVDADVDGTRPIENVGRAGSAESTTRGSGPNSA
jgi:hypothetical protein